MDTIASFIVLAILSLGTSNRRCEYSHAMTLPLESTIVDTAGTSPSTSCADPLATTSDARLDIRPIPPITGNSNAATITAASRQHHASLMTVTATGERSDMSYRVTTAVDTSTLLRLTPQVVRRLQGAGRHARSRRLRRWGGTPVPVDLSVLMWGLHA